MPYLAIDAFSLM